MSDYVHIDNQLDQLAGLTWDDFLDFSQAAPTLQAETTPFAHQPIAAPEYVQHYPEPWIDGNIASLDALMQEMQEPDEPADGR